MAGVRGIEPLTTVLETVVMPFNYTPLKLLLNYTLKLGILKPDCLDKRLEADYILTV